MFACHKWKSSTNVLKCAIATHPPYTTTSRGQPLQTNKQTTEIEKLAQTILDARANYPDNSLADLYDPLTMPADLLKAHQKLDQAVMKLYNFSKTLTEGDVVTALI